MLPRCWPADISSSGLLPRRLLAANGLAADQVPLMTSKGCLSYFIDIRDWLVAEHSFLQSEFPDEVHRNVGDDWTLTVSFNSSWVFEDPKRRTKGLSPYFQVVRQDLEAVRCELLDQPVQAAGGYARSFGTWTATGGRRASWWGEPGSASSLSVDEIMTELVDAVAFVEEHCDLDAHICWVHDEYLNHTWGAGAGLHRVAAYALSGWGDDAERFLHSTHMFLR